MGFFLWRGCVYRITDLNNLNFTFIIFALDPNVPSGTELKTEFSLRRCLTDAPLVPAMFWTKIKQTERSEQKVKSIQALY